MLVRGQRWFFASVLTYLLLIIVVSVVALGVLMSRDSRPIGVAAADATSGPVNRPAD